MRALRRLSGPLRSPSESSGRTFFVSGNAAKINRLRHVTRDQASRKVTEQRLIADEGVELASGTKMRLLGLGTWQARGRSALNAVLCALEVGYRHIDTAAVYGNEQQVGQAVAESGVPREEIFVTTKLPPSRAGRERATLEESLEALRFEYVDLWLIHWPPGGGARPDVWERLLELQAEGLARRHLASC
jgi:2,5-diketo-D-gluconate reductase A